jgi:hypothetical protein
VLEGKACCGEFYTFQIGLFAVRQKIEDLTITIEDLRPKSSEARSIPASAIRCFNQGGIDSNGRAFQKTIAVESGKVSALWFGIQIPADAEPGWYDGAIRVIASWAREKVNCHSTIDFAKLGVNAAHARIHALEVPGFQPPATFDPSDAIPVEPGRGWMLMIEQSE